MTAIGPDFEINFGEFIKSFLDAPLNRKCFKDFFRLCLDHAVGYLHVLKRKGYRLPTESGDTKRDIEDLAIDILGAFLSSRADQPFCVVFDYFCKNFDQDIARLDCGELYHSFTVLLRGYIKKELFRLTKQLDPQVANLKRQINFVLKSSLYEIVVDIKSGKEYVIYVAFREKLRLEMRSIPREELESLVEEAYSATPNITSLCEKVFELLSSSEYYENRLLVYELVGAVVAVLSSHIEWEGIRPTQPEGPKESLAREAIEKARSETLVWTESDLIGEFVRKDRITKEEATAFLKAVDAYLTDLGNHGDCDSIPDYFREVMPDSARQRYLKDYKYVFETVINRSVEEFRRRLRNDPTIGDFGDY